MSLAKVTREVKSLSREDKIKLFNSLPDDKKALCKAICDDECSKGSTISQTAKKIATGLGSLGKAIGPTVLKELIIPYFRSRAGITKKS